MLEASDTCSPPILLPSTGSQVQNWKDNLKNTLGEKCKHAKNETDLVQALHDHVGHVLVQHGRWYDDLVEPLVVSPQRRVCRLFLSTTREAEIHQIHNTYRFSQHIEKGKYKRFCEI